MYAKGLSKEMDTSDNKITVFKEKNGMKERIVLNFKCGFRVLVFRKQSPVISRSMHLLIDIDLLDFCNRVLPCQK